MHALITTACLALSLVGAQPQQLDALDRLQVWIERARIAPGSIDVRRQEQLRAILGDLRVRRARSGGDMTEVDLGLLELASLELREAFSSAPELLECARLGREALAQELASTNAELAKLLALEVLQDESRSRRPERLVAVQLLEGVHVPETLPVLLRAARDEDRDIAGAALRALEGWPNPQVHRFFLDELERRAPCTRVAGAHFAALRGRLDETTLEGLERQVARRYLSEDWREAARARVLVGALDATRAVPILIEALATWERRGEEGVGSRRIHSEIHAELQRISGRRIGPDPRSWSTWWEAVRDGRVALPDDILAAGGQPSVATFFGLQAATDRVVFVVDRSGSMDNGFGTGGRSRHAEAIDQLERFLRQSGPDTRFSIAVFSDKGIAWRTSLVSATESNLNQARKWLEGKEPAGETMLFEGLRAGLGLDRRGNLDVERCETDTVIVLCDGDTTEGKGWVAPWLAAENEERAELVFHCVQIGNDGNGTLEALAEGTGGQFLRVQG